MATGPGKYDDLCTYVREQSDAGGVIVMIFHGDRGSGFSIQADPTILAVLPAMLREMADDIAGDMDGSKEPAG